MILHDFRSCSRRCCAGVKTLCNPARACEVLMCKGYPGIMVSWRPKLYRLVQPMGQTSVDLTRGKMVREFLLNVVSKHLVADEGCKSVNHQRPLLSRI